MTIVRSLKVVGGTDIGDGKGPPNESCIAHLEEALAMAKEGRIHTVFVVAQGYDRGITSGWSQSPPEFLSTFEMLGGIENAKQDFMNLEIQRRDRNEE